MPSYRNGQFDGRNINPGGNQQDQYRDERGRERDGGGGGGYDDGYYNNQDPRRSPYRNNPDENSRGREARGRGVSGGGHVGSAHRESHDFQERGRQTSETFVPPGRDDFHDGRREIRRDEEFRVDPVQDEYGRNANSRHINPSNGGNLSGGRRPPPLNSDSDYPPPERPQARNPPFNDRNPHRLQQPNQPERHVHYEDDQEQFSSSNTPHGQFERDNNTPPDDRYRNIPQRGPSEHARNNNASGVEQRRHEEYYDHIPLEQERISNQRTNDRGGRREENPGGAYVDQRNYGRENPRSDYDEPPIVQPERYHQPLRNDHRQGARNYDDPQLQHQRHHHPQQQQQQHQRGRRDGERFYDEQNRRENYDDDLPLVQPQRYHQPNEQPQGARIYEDPQHQRHYHQPEQQQHYQRGRPDGERVYDERNRQPPQRESRYNQQNDYDEPPALGHQHLRQPPPQHLEPHIEEHFYDHIPHHSHREHEQDHRGSRPQQHQQQQPQQRLQQQRDEFYDETPPFVDEQNYDYPPSVNQHQQQRRHQQNPVNQEPPLRHDYGNRQQLQRQPLQDDTYSIASTLQCAASVAGDGREQEQAAETYPPHVEAPREETPPPPPPPNNNRGLQWNIRQIVPRQPRHERNNGEVNNQNFVAEEVFDENQNEQPVNDENDDWDSPVLPPPPQQQQQQQQPSEGRGSRGDFSQNNYTTRGGARGGGGARHNYSDFQAEPQQQQPPLYEDDYMGGAEEEPAARSYRPPGFSVRGGFSNGRGNLNHNDFERRGFDAGQNSNSYGGYSGYQGLQSQMERSRAPKDYSPKKRQLEEIYGEDRSELTKYGNTVCDGDAEIEVVGQAVQQHFDQWHEMGLNEVLLNNIQTASDYLKPRNIQKYCIPYIQEGLNVKVQSETGSGKTVAFLVPIIDNLISSKEAGPLATDGPIALIVAPTRELVNQLYEQARKLTANTGVSVACAYGQYAVCSNIADIRAGCNILVACVGRLLDLVERKAFTLSRIQYLIIDEPDRLLRDSDDDCEFLKLLTHVQLPSKHDRQTMLFSATLCDPNVQILDRHINLDNLVSISAKKESNIRVQYVVIAVPSYPSKFRYLIEYLKEITAQNEDVCPKVLVFINRRINVERVAIDITRNGFAATTLHGGRAQDLREEAYAYFRNGRAKVLVATDVCARGVDIYAMDFVVNYDLPPDKTTFLQRCGRTGRIHSGTAASFYCEDFDLHMADVITEVIEGNGQTPPTFLRGNVQETDFKYGRAGDEPQQSSAGYETSTYDNNVVNTEADDAVAEEWD